AVPAEEKPRRGGDSPVLVAAVDKIHAELGWTPERSDLRTIIRDAWNWHESHPGGYGRAGASPFLHK
ncbi:MAG: hypothetical protein JW909_11805, partial [Planctomycetes bacterium]|nr:hypothetical protein [Planctomycetota bacterium]